MASWSAGEYRTFLRAPAVVELHHMLRVEKAETHGVKNLLFQSQRFLPETTAVSGSNHPKSLRRGFRGAVITFPG